MQVDEPLDAETVPEEHAVQVTNEVAALLNLPASHAVQITAPTVLLNFPASQAAQTPVDALSR